MKKIAAGLLVMMLGLQGCGKPHSQSSETKNVFGEDNRIALTSSDYPWRTIGKLFGMGCTGTLVYRDLVLTAAHCVIDPKTKKLRTDINSFRPNFKAGTSAVESGISYVWWGTNDPDKFRGQDWAILRLTKPLGDSYGWLGIRSTNTETFPPALTVVGYSGDFQGGQTAGIHHNCTTRKREASVNFILHDCDTSRGSSGGPALRMYDNKLTVVGVNVAEYRNGGDTSLHLPQYDDAHANIVITTKDLIEKVKSIIAGH